VKFEVQLSMAGRKRKKKVVTCRADERVREANGVVDG
jgi:hypothetical protein